MCKENKIEKLKEEIKLPDKIERGLQETYKTILNEKNNKSNVINLKDSKKKKHLFNSKSSKAAAAVIAFICIGTVSTGAAGYGRWSGALNDILNFSEDEINNAQENGLDSFVNQTAVSKGITIRTEECITDGDHAFISFNVSGIEISDAEEVWMPLEKVNIKVKGAEAGINTINGTEKNEDGSYTFVMEIQSVGEKNILGKEIEIIIKEIGAYNKNNQQYTKLESGKWTFKWIIENNSEKIVKEYNKEIGDSGITLKTIEISPLSMHMYVDIDINRVKLPADEGEGIIPYAVAYQLKDGTIKNIDGGGSGASYDSEKGGAGDAFVNYSIIINPEEVKGVYFAKDISKFYEDEGKINENSCFYCEFEN